MIVFISSRHCGITVKGPPPDPFTPYKGFTPGTPVFTHYNSARYRYIGIPLIPRNGINGIKRIVLKK